jgi:hypothetical protein
MTVAHEAAAWRAPREFLVDLLMGAFAVAGHHFGGERKAVVRALALACGGLMAVEAGHTFAGVLAPPQFMDDGILAGGKGTSHTCR